MRILLADDEVEILHIYSEMLKGSGHAVTSVSNGREVLQWIDEKHDQFDLVIMDLYMPEMDGFQAIQVLREKGYDIPIIVMTGHFPEEEVSDRLKGLNVGISLRKPVLISTLLNAVHGVIGKKHK